MKLVDYDNTMFYKDEEIQKMTGNTAFSHPPELTGVGVSVFRFEENTKENKTKILFRLGLEKKFLLVNKTQILIYIPKIETIKNEVLYLVYYGKFNPEKIKSFVLDYDIKNAFKCKCICKQEESILCIDKTLRLMQKCEFTKQYFLVGKIVD